MEFKTDKYRRVRGGTSRLLDILCASCGTHVCFYQKDGPGPLKRMYIDRMHGDKRVAALQGKAVKSLPHLVCSNCKKLLGIPYTYEKEKRPAFRLFVGAIAKKIVSARAVK